MALATKRGRMVTLNDGLTSFNYVALWDHMTVPMATKRGRVVNYLDGLLQLLYLHDHIAKGHYTW